MKYAAQISFEEGEYVASCPELDLRAHGLSSASALDALRQNIRFQLELCPCSSIEEDGIELDVS